MLLLLLFLCSVLAEHATVQEKNNEIKISPSPHAKLLVNGKPIKEETVLHHNDRCAHL